VCNTIDVRGLKIANVTLSEALEAAKGYLDAEGKYTIFTPNAEIVQRCIEDKTKKLFELTNSADMLLPDGAGVVLASKILKEPLKQKVGGYDFSQHLLGYLNEIGGKLFLLGSKQETVELAAQKLKATYPNIEVFFNNGYFDHQNEENEAVIEKINAARPDLLFVCFGFPKQETWIAQNKERIDAKLMLGLGGTIDVIAGAKKYAPKIFIKLGLEWLYYLLQSPSRLGRYMSLPKFVFGTLFAKKHKKKSKKS